MKKSLGIFALGLALSTQVGWAQRSMTISQLFDCLEKGNSSIKAQAMGVETADEAVQVAKNNRLPDVNTSLSLSYIGDILMTDRNFSNGQWFSGPHFGNSFSLEAKQVVYSGGALSAGISMAELGRRMAENGVTMTRQGLRFATLGQYLDLYKIDNGIKVYEQNIALTKRLIDDVKSKQSQGMALKNDITRYELQLQTLQLGKKKLEDNREILNHLLCVSLGMEDVRIVPDESVAASPQPTGTVESAYPRDGEAYWKERSVANAPEMTQAELNAKMAQQQLRLAKADQMPKVAIVAADNFNGPFVYDLPPVDKNIMNWYVGVGVTYSLSNLWKSDHKIKKAQKNISEVEQRNVTTAENIDTRVNQAYTLYEQSFVDHRTQQKSVELATQNYTVVNERYLNQIALITDMIDASNMKLNAELQEVDARINIAFAYYKLKYIAGEL